MTNCFFCKFKVEPSFKDIENLEKFITPRKKIVGRERSGVCASHQRSLTKQVKYARFFGLLPYISYQDAR